MIDKFLAHRIKQNTNAIWVNIKYVTPFGMAKEWIVKTKGLHDDESEEISRSSSLTMALLSAWIKTRRSKKFHPTVQFKSIKES